MKSKSPALALAISLIPYLWLFFIFFSSFTPENGATRVLSRSHRSGTIPTQVISNAGDDHPNQVQLIAPAGTTVAFNSHFWHGGMKNETDSPRQALHSYFCRRDKRQQLDQRKWLRKETIARLSPESRFILDVNDI